MEIILIAAIIGVIILYSYKTQEKEKPSGKRKTTSGKQHKDEDIPGMDWVFKPTIDDPEAPTIVNTYRKSLTGKKFEEIVKMIYIATEVEKDKIISAQMFMQTSEPLLELVELNYLERDEIEQIMWHYFDALINHYSNIGAIGQLKNIKDMYYYFDRKIPIMESELSFAFDKAKFRNELLKKLKKEEFVYQKDFQRMDSYKKLGKRVGIIDGLVNSNKIEKSKQGRYICYKLKGK